MTSFSRPAWFDKVNQRYVVDDHAELLAFEREQDAERAPVLRCACFVETALGKPEFTGHCDLHRDGAA